MVLSGAVFSDYARAVHIIAVLAAFGVPFAYPLIFSIVERVDRRSVPTFHQVRKLIGRWLVNPALGLVLIGGIVLASNEHLWKAFFVQWGVAAVVVLGALEGSFLMPKSGRLAELATRDLADGSGQWSAEYLALRSRVGIAAWLMSLIVIVTIVLMATQP
ncbi:MAG: hypothetical protein ACYDHH_22625 [Solirubrobacteraceae bacterium]